MYIYIYICMYVCICKINKQTGASRMETYGSLAALVWAGTYVYVYSK